MNTQNLMLAIATGLLRAESERLPGLFQFFDKHVALDKVVDLERPSLIMQDCAALRTPFKGWVLAMRQVGIKSMSLGMAEQDLCAEPYMMAGFAGGRPWTLAVETSVNTTQFLVGTVSAPPHAMTCLQFAELINAQPEPPFYWDVVEQEVNQFHRCNDMPEVERDDIETFFTSGDSEDRWNFIGDALFLEIQVEAHTFEKFFIVPDEFRTLVKPVVPFEEFDIAHEAFVDLYAYDTEEVSGSDLVQLVEAQGFAKHIWSRCSDLRKLVDELGDAADFDEFPTIAAADWPAYLRDLGTGETDDVCDGVIAVLADECAARQLTPVIPEALAEVFGPDDEERRRTSFRLRLQHDLGWGLARDEHSWLAYTLFQRPQPVDMPPPSASHTTRQTFAAALHDIHDFALRVRSEFANAFRFALLLSEMSSNGLDHHIDPRALRNELAQRFGEDNHERIEPAVFVVDLFTQFNWAPSKVLGLAAVSAADVFGCMGSWNDQSFDGADQAHYETVSSRLYDAMNEHYVALLST